MAKYESILPDLTIKTVISVALLFKITVWTGGQEVQSVPPGEQNAAGRMDGEGWNHQTSRKKKRGVIMLVRVQKLAIIIQS